MNRILRKKEIKAVYDGHPKQIYLKSVKKKNLMARKSGRLHTITKKILNLKLPIW